MKTRRCISKALTALPFFLLSAAGCSVRGVGPGELLSSPPDTTTDDAGAPVPLKRLTVSCAVPPTPKDSEMVEVPEGSFQMGCNAAVDSECKADEDPQHTVTLGAFQIDKTEVTAGQYYECVAAGACLEPTCDFQPCDDDTSSYPVVCVIHSDAEAYCAWQQKRLPTEAEWEKAARGTASLKYPWGNDQLDCNHANYEGCIGKAEPVGSYPKGASPYGALDMAGNVVEYVADYYDATYYASSPASDPAGPATGDVFVGRGGGFRSVQTWQRTGVRDTYEASYVRDSLGFRCARSASANE